MRICCDRTASSRSVSPRPRDSSGEVVRLSAAPPLPSMRTSPVRGETYNSGAFQARINAPVTLTALLRSVLTHLNDGRRFRHRLGGAVLWGSESNQMTRSYIGPLSGLPCDGSGLPPYRTRR